MLATNYSDFRKNMREYMDTVVDDVEAVIITRNGNRNVVVLSQEEYDNLLENQHVLGSAKNRAWLDESMKQMASGKIVRLEDLPVEEE